MSHPLHSFRLKLNRAQEHAAALNIEIDAWTKRDPYEVFGEYEPGPPEKYIFRVRFFETIPAEWGIILGDFTHKARSALDHLADALVRANGGTPTTQTQFPICVSPFEWPGQLTRLKGASERHVSMIQAMQPYNRRDRYGWHTVWEAMGDPLAIVNRLSSVDKHRVLNATPAVVTGVKWDVKPVQDVNWVQKNMVEITDESLEDGDVMLRFDVEASGPNPELYLERTDTVEIRIEHRVDLEGTATPS